MPLLSIKDPGEVDAFGVRFTMEDRGQPVRCHVFRSAINATEPHAACNGAELLERFKMNRGMFERLASNLYDAGHKNPWIDAFIVRE